MPPAFALTEEPVLPIPLPPAPPLKLLAENQERVTRHILSVMRLPFSLDPYDPYICRVDAAGNESEAAQNDIDPEVCMKALGEPDGEWGKQEGQDKADDLGRGVLAHGGHEDRSVASKESQG